MSVLVFIDESRWKQPGKDEYYATVAGVAIEEVKLPDFCRKIMKLKGKFFKRPGISEFPLRGRLLLNNRALESYRKQEFLGELFSLCRLEGMVTFGTTRRCSVISPPEELEDYLKEHQQGAISDSDKYSAKVISLLHAYLFERINSYVLEYYPGQQAKLVFKSVDPTRDSTLSSSIMNFIYHTTYGGGFDGILGNPFFATLPQTSGLQLADLFAYIINQYHGGRPEMRSFYSELESMQFSSAIEKDDFSIRGINLLE
ncbi:DUF3800 domain-containing protein [bacterium]|nr:DUF3800 domain-containing protein [bacterium]MBU1652813.1 DUF3800 domain-containing protein [bacterium]